MPGKTAEELIRRGGRWSPFDKNLRRAMAVALRTLEERQNLARSLHNHAERNDQMRVAASWAQRAGEIEREFDVIRESIFRLDQFRRAKRPAAPPNKRQRLPANFVELRTGWASNARNLRETSAMPLYYFVLKSGSQVIPDREGVELPDREAARLYAISVARELMRNRELPSRAWRIEIRDDDLRLCSEVLFADADETLEHLTQEQRLLVENNCRLTGAMHDAFNEVRASLSGVKETLAQADAIIAAVSRGTREQRRKHNR